MVSLDRAALRIESRLLHGPIASRVEGALVLPIFRSTVFESGPPESELRYARRSNLPNQLSVAAQIADLEGAEQGLVAASGMAAVSAVLLALLRSGDHLLVQEGVYGGTRLWLRERAAALGWSVDSFDGTEPDTWAAKRRPNTRVVWVESLTNPLLRVADHEAVVRFARAHGLVSVIDNTFASPINFRPLVLGYDLAVHSATKYLNGHHDVVAGAIAGGAPLLAQIRDVLSQLGGCLDPQACYLLQRGLHTLALRVERQNANALALARALEAHPQVRFVGYPGLASHPEHGRAARLFGGGGGVLVFAPAGGVDAVERLVDRVQLAAEGPSLGGVRTTLARPARTSHAGLSRAELAAAGIPPDLVRIAVGIEAAEDLIADFTRALEPDP
ncbi:MAG: PLP-dependent transferase [Proteobacteria bacterium]|nr:PLP-dependent transferase [Pseudomonadota bacterium]